MPHSAPAASHDVYIQLLDSSQGRTIQFWHFANKSQITIGRAENNDISIADEQVSRLHAKLVWEEGAWRLISLGRNGTLVNDRVVAEAEMTDQSIFRLGSNGPMLRFRLDRIDSGRSETVSSFDPSMLAMLQVDETRKQQEVDEVAESSLFQELKEKSQQLKAGRQNSG
jgi:pSer/pThr/pTyr-binding forkhead associated (FHA) protein